jgi:hypothetical protein
MVRTIPSSLPPAARPHDRYHCRGLETHEGCRGEGILGFVGCVAAIRCPEEPCAAAGERGAGRRGGGRRGARGRWGRVCDGFGSGLVVAGGAA